jgi:hypothetical protein
VDLYFSDYFGVAPATIDAYGVFDVSLVSDLPLFIDPFHLFNSDDKRSVRGPGREHRALPQVPRDRSGQPLTQGAMETLYCFPEGPAELVRLHASSAMADTDSERTLRAACTVPSGAS